jgi:TfoX N-terminal domain
VVRLLWLVSRVTSGYCTPSVADEISPAASAANSLLCTISRMAYDELLAGRIRDLIGPDPELTEKKMFGGLAFLIRGHMAISASGQGGVLVHVDPERADELIATTAATVAVMQGREMPGWLRVSADNLATDAELSPWVEVGIGHARSLPPKTAAGKARK